MREWCRVSYAALAHGFSIRHLGSELIRLFRHKSYVKSVEVIYFTSSSEDVATLRKLTESSEKIIAAMNKMASELEYECATCSYQEVCDEADGLKGMRERLKKRSGEAMYG
jgi:CO dehydrogenase/acetyl-CoA synthase beta subunit